MLHTQAIQLRKNGMERKTRKCDLASGGNEYMLPAGIGKCQIPVFKELFG